MNYIPKKYSLSKSIFFFTYCANEKINKKVQKNIERERIKCYNRLVAKIKRRDEEKNAI